MSSLRSGGHSFRQGIKNLTINYDDNYRILTVTTTTTNGNGNGNGNGNRKGNNNDRSISVLYVH